MDTAAALEILRNLMDGETIELDASLAEQGVDSLVVAEWAFLVGQQSGRAITDDDSAIGRLTRLTAGRAAAELVELVGLPRG